MVVETTFSSYLTGEDALVLFFGVYMTLVISLSKKFRIFDMYLFFSRNGLKKLHAIRRFCVGFILVDTLPIAWFWVLYRFIIPATQGAFPIMAAAFACFSILGFEKFLHGVLATEYHEKFYTQEEYELVMDAWGRKDDEDNRFKIHKFTGMIYLIIFPSIAYFIGRIPIHL
ncbi:hypothetical protein [Methanobacterium aggregans]|uniref:hypothetical protein n=1 Tax=Methanobacterium aggregans TaxID=1615586 RepID=UPI001AE1EAFE|nr:hypothetical protein [Methanobacterium aggregans]MBP2045985.1 hypothetical protein [Methanobacterium aggregans]